MIDITKPGIKFYLAASVSVLVLLFIQVFLIEVTSNILIPFVFFILLSGIFLLGTFIKDFFLFLLFLSVITYGYIDSEFNYYLNYMVIQDLPVLLIAFLAVLVYFSKSVSLEVSLSYFGKPLLLLFLFSFVLMIMGIARGNQSYFAIYEFVNFTYLFLAFPISIAITDPKKYHTIFNIILAAGVFISSQYIINGVIFPSDTRFTSFHASLFPVILALLVAKFIFLRGETIKRLGVIALIGIFTAGAFGTLTRSVWISMVLAILATTGFYFYDKYATRLKRYTNFVMLGAAIVSLFFLYSYAVASIESAQKEGLDYAAKGSDRIESLSSQTSDASFMMRIEIAYYLYEKFMGSPLIGEGLGSFVGYKIFGDSELNYPDSVWFYYLWKGGFLFFILAVWLYVRFFKTAIKIYRATDDKLVKMYMLAFIGGFTAMMFYGLFAPQMVKYSKLNLIFAVIYAFVLAEEKKLNE